MKRKLIFMVFLMFVFMIYESGKISAITYPENQDEDFIEITQTLGYEKFYDEKGNLLQETSLNLKEYNKRVQNFNKEKLQYQLSSDMQDTQVTINGDGPPEFEGPPPGWGTEPPEGSCSVYSSMCEDFDAFDAEYTTHTTRVKIYPKNSSPQPSVKINNELTWDIVPNYRMIDIMTVTYNENYFEPVAESVKGRVVGDYHYRYYSRTYWFVEEEEYDSQVTHNYNANDICFQIQMEGIMFNVDLRNYKDTYIQFGNGITEFTSYRITFEKINITLDFDLVTLDGSSLKDNDNILEAYFMGQYHHFWEMLKINPDYNLGIMIGGSRSGLFINDGIHPHYDGPRHNNVTFPFHR